MTDNLIKTDTSRNELNEEITERARMGEALRASENQLHNITNAMPALIAYVDSGLRYRFVNKTWEKWHMRPRSDAVGHHLLDVIGKEVYERIKPNIIKVLSGNTTNFEGKENYRCGYVSHVKASYIPDFDENNNVRGFYALVVDISARKRAEEELRAAKQLLEKTFNSMDEAVLVVNPGSRTIIAVNPAVERLFGYSKEELIGRGTETVHIDKPSYEEFVKQMLAGLDQSGEFKYEYRLRKKDGTVFLCDLTITEIRDESGKRTELVGVLTDITKTRLIEQELLKAQKLESLSLLAGGIAHDFNNILMGILGNISLAKFLNRSEKKPLKVLQEAEKAALRAKGLTTQLLTFSSGGTPLKNAAKIKDLVTEVAQFALRGSKSEAVNRLDKNLATVNIDSDQISQVINNLLINADQAIPEGGAITIRGKNVTLTDNEEYTLPAGQYVKISIEDNGVGIPTNIIDRIFDPFFTTKSGGSGLGLSTSYSIIKNHGGLLKVTSKPGEGSTFHIYLPAMNRPVRRKNRDRIYTNGKGKILVMDDDKLVRDVLAEMLTVLGYQSELTRDGEEAERKYVEALQAGEHYEAVILDLTVRGGMGGKQAMTKLKKIDPNINAIVASGYSTDVVLEDYGRFGFSGYVTKPFELNTLSKVLNKTIRASG